MEESEKIQDRKRVKVKGEFEWRETSWGKIQEEIRLKVPRVGGEGGEEIGSVGGHKVYSERCRKEKRIMRTARQGWER